MINPRERFSICLVIFCLLLAIYLLTFTGMGISDDEQLFEILSGSLSAGQGYNALPLLGNDRILGNSGNVEPLHLLFGIPFYNLAEMAGWGRAQSLHLPAGIYTALSAALLAGIALRRGYSKNTTVIFALAFGMGTIAFPYARTNFREPLAMLCLTGAAACLDRMGTSDKSFWEYFTAVIAMTLLVGLAALTKLACGLCLPFFLAAAWLNLKQKGGISTRRLILAFSLCLLIVLVGLWALNACFPQQPSTATRLIF